MEYTAEELYEQQTYTIHNKFRVLDNNSDVILYKCTAYDLSTACFESCHFQRRVVDSHVEALYHGLLSSKTCDHPFILFHKTNKYIRIADGQHRYLALKKCSEDELKKISCYVMILLFPTDVTNVVLEARFHRINTNCPLDKCTQANVSDYMKEICSQRAFGVYKGRYPRISTEEETTDKVENKKKYKYTLKYKDLRDEIERHFNLISQITPQTFALKLIKWNYDVHMRSDEYFEENNITDEYVKEQCRKREFYLAIGFPKCFYNHILKDL